jgi:hypothetical protein
MRPRQVIASVLFFSAAPMALSGCVADEHRPAPPVEAAADASPPQPPPPPADLDALRTELLNTTPDAALAQMTHFRPLCDKDGYPLVGNVASKVQLPGLQPSAFCAEVRKRK